MTSEVVQFISDDLMAFVNSTYDKLSTYDPNLKFEAVDKNKKNLCLCRQYRPMHQDSNLLTFQIGAWRLLKNQISI